MTATEERERLMQAAAELQARLAEIRELLRPLSQLVADLTAEGDSLMLAAADEQGHNIKVKRMTYGGKPVPEHIAQAVALEGSGITEKPQGKTRMAKSLPFTPPYIAMEPPPIVVRRGKKKRKQKPLSEERKAQLREQLKKARAARGSK